MKTQPSRNSPHHNGAASPPYRERATNAEYIRVESAVPHRRYPSLAEDFQPRARKLRTRRSAQPADTTSTAFESTSFESTSSEFPYLRIIALLAILVIIAALVASS